MFIRSALIGLALATVPVLGAPALAPPAYTPLEARSVISHDAVIGFAEAVPDTVAGNLMLKYRPKLKVTNGCVPFPAVDAEGNTRFDSFPSMETYHKKFVILTCSLTVVD